MKKTRKSEIYIYIHAKQNTMKLTIAERFLVLTHKTEKTGFNLGGPQFTMGLIGAMFLDLFQNKDINILDKKLICLTQYAAQSAHPQIVAEILKSKKTRKIKDWFSRLNVKANKFKIAVLDGLVKQRIIEIEKKKFLGLIPYKVTHLINKPLQAEILREIKNFILMGAEISDENKMVLGIIAASKSTNFLGVDRDERKEIRNKLKTLNLESTINHEMNDAIKQMQAVMAMVVITPAISS